tara:strand:- start:1791 stop:2087 length:297 start_codon:yes stop_codon:yes gene_type:complete
MVSYNDEKIEINEINVMDYVNSIQEKLQERRMELARPYVTKLKKQFPHKNTFELIAIADKDLQQSNEDYRNLTEEIIKIEKRKVEVSKLLKLINQIQP